MFYYLSNNGNGRFGINYSWGRKNFQPNGSFTNEEISAAFNFAYDMTFGGRGQHRANRTGGTHQRRKGEQFANVFQGKLGEIAVYKEFKSLIDALELDFTISEPDFTEEGLGFWDNFDLEISQNNGQNYDEGTIKVAVKSIKHFSQLLLLETQDWDSNGQYLHGMNVDGNTVPVNYKFVFLSRIYPSSESILKYYGLLNSNTADREGLRNNIVNEDIDWSYETPCFITDEDLRYIIQNNYTIESGNLFSAYGNNYTEIDADNYYVRIADMHVFNMDFEQLLYRGIR